MLDLKNELVTSNAGTLDAIKGKYLELLSFFVINNNIVLEKRRKYLIVFGVLILKQQSMLLKFIFQDYVRSLEKLVMIKSKNCTWCWIYFE